MTDMVVVDADAHINEDVAAWSMLHSKYPGWIQAGSSGGLIVAEIEGKHYPNQEGFGRGVPADSALNPAATAGASDLTARLADMDSEGIDIQVLYGGLVIGITSFQDHGFAADFATQYNDWLLGDICAKAPERLKAVATVPLQDVDASITELRRAVSAGAVAITIPPVVGRMNLDDPLLYDFYEAAESEGIALAVHSAPGMNLPLPGAERFENYAQVHCLSFPVDQLVAFTSLTMGGILDRFPELRVVFLESGIGWVPYFTHRVDEHFEKRPELLPGMKSSATEAIERGQCYFSFECEENLLDSYIEHLGSSSIVFASDYPHWDADFPGTVDEALEHAAEIELESEVIAKIMGTNALRLYGMG